MIEVHGVNQQENRRHRYINFVCAISLYVAETPTSSSIKDQEPKLPIIPFGIVAYGFVGQPFSKQLCISSKLFTLYSEHFSTEPTVTMSVDSIVIVIRVMLSMLHLDETRSGHR